MSFNILSLFDGMSCGQIALDRANIKYDNYFASEVDKYAITVTQYNYPNTIQIGDVTKINGHDLPKIDLLIGGSPCQGFSFAGKGLNFKDPRSKLFFEYVRVLKECRKRNSRIKFLMENVRMKQESQDIISQYLGVEPVKINSQLVSAQNRVRLYWTNISKNITQPTDKKIYLKDIIEDGVVDRGKSSCVDANYFKGGNLKSNFLDRRRQLAFGESLSCKGEGVKENSEFSTSKEYEMYHGTVYDRCMQTGEADLKGHDIIRRTYDINGKSPTLTAYTGGNTEPKITLDLNKWRKLTPTECERLQTVPDNYTLVDEFGKQRISNSQRYKMLGNGWTVDVIAHILKNIHF